MIILSIRSKMLRYQTSSRRRIKCHNPSKNLIVFGFINTRMNCSSCEVGQAGRQTARRACDVSSGLVMKGVYVCIELCIPAHTLSTLCPLLGCLFFVTQHSCYNDFYTELGGCCLNRGSQSAMPLRPTAVLGN